MGRTARERLAKLLDDAEAPGAFSAQILAPADALQVEVDGVGAVQAPVRAPLAKKLIAVAPTGEVRPRGPDADRHQRA